jgi:thioredoxin-related protein
MAEESPSYIKPFMQKSQMNYPVALGNDDIQKRFQVEGLPKALLIDRQGRVAVSHAGIVDRDAFARDIEELLSEK